MTLKIHSDTLPSSIKIGDLEIPCVVLEDGTRVLSHRGLTRVLGGRRGGARKKKAGADLPIFIAADSLKPFISRELMLALTLPVIYDNPQGGGVINGVRAELLPEICSIWLSAREADALLSHQYPVAARAEVIVRGLAHIGIIGLIDEATGYQDIRAKDALAKILEKFIEKELQPWTKTFPDEFYKQMFRLRDWPWRPWDVKRPSVVGKYTNDLVYERLVPGVLDELRRKNPKLPQGYRKHRHFQWFTPDFGHPKLKEHLASVIVLMRASSGWDQFIRNMNRALPKLNETIELPLDD